MSKQPIIIGISGASASGKSLLANTIIKELGSEKNEVISEDSYYKNRPDLSLQEREKINYDHPDAFDHGLLVDHLVNLQSGQTIDVPRYDFSRHERSQEIRPIKQNKILIIEGILLFVDPRLRELMDIRIYMDTPLDICLIRRLHRDILERDRTLDSVLEQYENTVRPIFMQFIEP